MKRIYILLALMAILVGVTSCSKDFLNTAPTSSYDAGMIFTTTDNAKYAINGMHKAMVAQYNSRQNQSGYTGMQILMDVLGEDVVFPTRGNGWWVNELQWLGHTDENNWPTLYPYRFFYKLIANANMILDNVDNTVGPEGDKIMIKGQALAYRGLSYFWLVQLYGKRYVAGGDNTSLAVPLVIDSKEVEKPLETVDKIYAQVITDLETSITLLQDPKNTFKSPSKADFTVPIVQGLRARVALVMQDWVKAEQYAVASLTKSTSTLMSQADYTAGFNNATNPEWMWGFEMISDQTLYFYGYMAYMSWNFNSTNIRTCPKCINSKLYAEISGTDIRKTLWDPTGKAWTMPRTTYTKKPYMNRKFQVLDPASSVADAVYMRRAEMLLIAAEAQAMQNKAADAQNNLFTLLKARDNSYVKSSSTGATLLKEIHTQRRIELWGEGHRWLDLKRLNLSLDRNGANHDAAVSLTMSVPAGDARWKFKIPKNEIDANKQIPKNINQ